MIQNSLPNHSVDRSSQWMVAIGTSSCAASACITANWIEKVRSGKTV